MVKLLRWARQGIRDDDRCHGKDPEPRAVSNVTSGYRLAVTIQVYAFHDDDQDLQVTLVQGLLHEESAQEHHENLPVMEYQDLPVIHYKGRASQKSRKIPHSSSRLRSMRKTGSEKASKIVQTEKMVETYLQRRRHNKKV
ncbi:uncharacterized protein [Haliotis cracherodii]|uniref:uncharacterized protein n=1 Tax=Haliotis cracherodii TaxID=6455 RepID=UPI0039E9A48F